MGIVNVDASNANVQIVEVWSQSTINCLLSDCRGKLLSDVFFPHKYIFFMELLLHAYLNNPYYETYDLLLKAAGTAWLHQFFFNF